MLASLVLALAVAAAPGSGTVERSSSSRPAATKKASKAKPPAKRGAQSKPSRAAGAKTKVTGGSRAAPAEATETPLRRGSPAEEPGPVLAQPPTSPPPSLAAPPSSPPAGPLAEAPPAPPVPAPEQLAVPLPSPPPPPVPAPARATGRKRVAVMEIKGVQGVSPGSVEILSSVIAADVARSGYDVIAKSDIVAMLGFERQKQMLGCTEDTGCIAEIGGSLGVDHVMSGQVGQLGSQYNVSLLVVDARKSKVVTRLSSFCEKNEDALLRAVRAGVVTVVAAMKGGPPPLPIAAAPLRTPWTRSRTSAYVSWGASAALLAGGVAAGLAAKSRYDDLAARRAQPGYDHLWADEEKGIRTLNLTADVLYGGAIAAGALGTWIWFRADRSVALVPTLAPGGGALAVAGSF